MSFGIDYNQPKPLNQQYAKLLKQSGWFTVKVLDILMRSRNPSDSSSNSNKKDLLGTSLGTGVSKCNQGKGAIVDSGTTVRY